MSKDVFSRFISAVVLTFLLLATQKMSQPHSLTSLEDFTNDLSWLYEVKISLGKILPWNALEKI